MDKGNQILKIFIFLIALINLPIYASIVYVIQFTAAKISKEIVSLFIDFNCKITEIVFGGTFRWYQNVLTLAKVFFSLGKKTKYQLIKQCTLNDD
jgi:hypothetical protein